MVSGADVIRNAYMCDNYIKECGITVQSLNHTLSSKRAHELNDATKQNIFEIFSHHMKTLYEKTWGWEPESLWNEMFSEKSIYLLLADEETNLAAYAHFQVPTYSELHYQVVIYLFYLLYFNEMV